MTMQRLCHASTAAVVGSAILLGTAAAVANEPTMHDYPTQARVEYVNECVGTSRGQLANIYQCSCVIDRIATSLSYEDFVEAFTYAKYSGLGGDRGGVFRDSEQAKKSAQLFKETEAAARRECGL